MSTTRSIRSWSLTRGCGDILIAVTDGLQGMSEALEAVYPASTWQTCLVHLMRQSLDRANWKERKALIACETGPWGTRFPTLGKAWRRAWASVIPFFAFPPEVRRAIYTTNALEKRPCPHPERDQDARSRPER